MTIFFTNIRSAIRIIFVLSCVLFFFWILNENIPIAGIKKITYIFGMASGSVTQLRPMARIGESGVQHGISYQKVLEDPVYFDIRTPVTYETLSIEMLYKNHTARQIGIGIRQYPTQLDFLFIPFQTVETRGEWTRGRAEISLEAVKRMPGKYSLSLSVPGLAYHPDGLEYVLASRMDIRLKRTPLTFQNFWTHGMKEIFLRK